MYKIVFFDIDGTLLTTTKELPDSAVRAVHQLQENRVVAAIATGRTPFNIQFLLDTLDVKSYVVFNGGLIVHQNKVIYQVAIEPSDVISLRKRATSNGHSLIESGKDGFYIQSEKQDWVIDAYLARNWKLDRLAKQPLAEPVSQMELFCTPEEAQAYIDAYPSLTFYPWVSRPNAFNVIPKSTSKASGIAQLLEILGIDRSEAAAFGDGPNDVEMLSYVGMGVAMGNSVAELRRVSKHITKHVNEDGIEAGLKEIGLI